jgi:regulator of replication initiation timing
VVEGNTPDFIWYEMDLLQRKLSDISARLTHVMKVSQARDADQKKMMRDLITENTELRVNNSSLKQQVTELTEMINGTPV